jgi:outer membrane lipopolysaccharide assembly protein LptE/RlpB
VPALIGAVLCLLLLAGCGYRLVGGQDGLLANRPLALGQFVNKTYRANLEAELTRALQAELARRTHLVDRDSGELVLSGTVQALTFEPVSYTAADKVREYRVTITAAVALKERVSGRVIWQGTETGRQHFPTNADLALQRNSEQEAVAAVCRDLTERIYQQLSHTF